MEELEENMPGDMDTMAVFHTADKIYYPIHSNKTDPLSGIG